VLYRTIPWGDWPRPPAYALVHKIDDNLIGLSVRDADDTSMGCINLWWKHRGLPPDGGKAEWRDTDWVYAGEYMEAKVNSWEANRLAMEAKRSALPTFWDRIGGDDLF
jgi:hypothetical protein